MKQTPLNPKGLKILVNLSLVFVVISTLLMLYNAVAYLDFTELLQKPEIYGIIVAVNTLIIFVTQLLFIITIIYAISTIKIMRWTSMGILLVGIISLFSLFGHYGCLTDIAKELPRGLEVNREIQAIWIAMFWHFLFFISFFIYLIRIRHYSNTHTLEHSMLMSENLYLIMHITGVICAGLGLFEIVSEFYMGLSPQTRQWFVLPILLITVAPYLLVAAGWYFNTIREHKAGNIDEKQKMDMILAGYTAWLVSIPIMLFLYIYQYNNIQGLISIFWLPIYIFTTLFIFSACSLLYYKKGSFSLNAME